MVEERVRKRERVQEKAAEKTAPSPAPSFGKCPHCGAATVEEFEICPVCGWKLVDYCTFCGAPMSREDVDCPECGMPSEGVMCPDCGIRNFRPFCRQCSQPLSRAARRAVEKAKQDPKVQEAARLLERVAELKRELDGALPEDGGEAESAEPTEGELRLKELMAKVGFTAAELPKASKRRVGRSREEIMAEYQKTLEETNKVFEEMVPPAGSTPQEQRNYYTARKVAVMEVVEKTWYGIREKGVMCWECNKCHVLHNSPAQCAVREFGGKWIQCVNTREVPEGTPGAEKFTEKLGERKVYKREE